MASNHDSTLSRSRSLGLFDVVCLILGVIIGSGIYRTPSSIAGLLGEPWLIMAIWATGGLLSLAGALCYAELASAYPKQRGEYFYLRRAYGDWAGFLFAWARLAVIHTGNIAIMAYIASTYAAQWAPFPHSQPIIALAVILLFTGINIMGLREGKWTQNLLVCAQLTGLLLVACLIISLSPREAAPSDVEFGGWPALFLAFIFVQFTFGGWSDCAFVTVEMRNPKRNILRAMLLGIAAVTGVYLLINAALLIALGPGGMAESEAVVAEAMRRVLGEPGALAISVLVIVTALGSVNGMILTGGRLFAALGRDHRIFGVMAPRDGGPDGSASAFLIQAGVAAALVLSGRFEDLVVYTTAAHWLFFAMCGVSLFILRYKDPQVERPYRVHFYPLTPILFIAASMALIYSSLTYAGVYSLVGFGIVFFGLFLYWADSLMKRRDANHSTPE